jgi:hypothetical protein
MLERGPGDFHLTKIDYSYNMPTTRGNAARITAQAIDASQMPVSSNPVQPEPIPRTPRYHSRGVQIGPASQTPLEYIDSEARRMGFSSLAQAVLQQISDSSDPEHSAIMDYTALLTTIVGKKRFNTTIATYNKGFMRGVTQLLTAHITTELDALVARPESRFNMKRFTPEHIETFNPTRLESAHRQYAPTLHGMLHAIVHKDHSRPAQADAPRKQRPYDRNLVATTAICMLSYARHRESNGLQVRRCLGNRFQAADFGRLSWGISYSQAIQPRGLLRSCIGLGCQSPMRRFSKRSGTMPKPHETYCAR